MQVSLSAFLRTLPADTPFAVRSPHSQSAFLRTLPRTPRSQSAVRTRSPHSDPPSSEAPSAVRSPHSRSALGPKSEMAHVALGTDVAT